MSSDILLSSHLSMQYKIYCNCTITGLFSQGQTEHAQRMKMHFCSLDNLRDLSVSTIQSGCVLAYLYKDDMLDELRIDCMMNAAVLMNKEKCFNTS